MRQPIDDELTPGLRRQLAAIERSAAAELDALAPQPHLRTNRPHARNRAHQPRPSTASPARHALVAELRRAHREAVRVRRLMLAAILTGIALCVAGALSERLGGYLLGIVLLGAGGLLIGLGAAAGYYANRRMQQCSEEFD